MDRVRHIDTSGLPKGFDIADLVATGISDEELIAWCKARVRPGPPKLLAEEMNPAKRQSKPEAKPAVKPQAAKVISEKSNVVALPEPKTLEELDIPPEFSEDSIAEEFTRQYKNQLAYCGPWGTWLQWKDNRWQKDETAIAVDYSRRVCRETSLLALDRLDLGAKSRTIANSICTRRTIAAIENIARSDRRHVVRPSQFDADQWLLNTPAGMVDLKTGKVRATRRDDWCQKQTAVGPGGDCPDWIRFLQDCTNGDAALQTYLQRIAGYVLTGSTSEEKFFFIYGGGGNGKGTYLNTLMWIMDSYGRESNMDTFTEQRFTKHAAEIAFFQGARLVVASETNAGQRWNEARIKTMTGGDPITANFMHQNPFTFIPNFKLLFTGNHKPHLRNVDAAIKRRLYLIPFDYEVPQEKIDFKLKRTLKDQAGGILNWAIEGCLDWQKYGLAPPTSVIAATQEYFESEDKIQSFLDECCELGSNCRTQTTLLWKRFSEWADSQGEYSGGRKGFLDMLAVKGFRSVKLGGEQVIDGIGIPLCYIPPAKNFGDY